MNQNQVIKWWQLVFGSTIWRVVVPAILCLGVLAATVAITRYVTRLETLSSQVKIHSESLKEEWRKVLKAINDEREASTSFFNQAVDMCEEKQTTCKERANQTARDVKATKKKLTKLLD